MAGSQVRLRAFRCKVRFLPKGLGVVHCSGLHKAQELGYVALINSRLLSPFDT